MKFPMKLFYSGILVLTACQSPSSMNSQDKIIFKDSSGHVLKEADIANFTGEVNYEIQDKINVSATAHGLHQEARVLGQQGKYDLAIGKLEQAISLEPNWAYPVYDLAFTYLLKEDFANALKYYRQTNTLKPKGFFTAKTALYALEGEESGKFPRGMYLGYLQIEWANNPTQKMEIAKGITEKVPDFAPAWKDLANLVEDNVAKEKAIELGLSKNPDAETKGILLINKASLLNDQGKKDAAIQLLGNLIFSPDATTGSVALAKFTLKSFSTSNPN